MEIPLFGDLGLWEESGIWYPVPIDFSRQPHLLCCGPSGSGKSFLGRLLLGKIYTHIPNAKAYILDYKHDDFRFLDGAPRYYAFDACTDGLNAFYEAFRARQSGEDPSRDFLLLVFDEWAAYVSMLDKNEAAKATRTMGVLLMLCRSYNCHILVLQQRGDSSYFSTARDNFSLVVALGSISKESREMFFSGFREEIKPVRRLGEGYMLANGAILHHIQVPTVRNTEKLNAAIRSLVT